MTEVHEVYRVQASTLMELVNQLNNVLGLLSNRLDKMEGLRDSPSFYSSNFKYPATTISGFLKATATSDEADFESLTPSDLGLTTTEIEDGSVKIISGAGVTVAEMGESFVKITDSNETIIHQLGDDT